MENSSRMPGLMAAGHYLWMYRLLNFVIWKIVANRKLSLK